MATLAELIVKIGADATQYEKHMGKVERSLNKMGGQLQAIGGKLSAGLTVPLAALGTASLTYAGNFEQGMNRVAAITEATGDKFQELREQAKELGRTTEYSATQAADAMGFLAMAGFNADEILGAMPGTLQLASAAQMDLARAADIVTNIVTGYNLEIENLAHANDVLVKAMTSTNVDLEMLGESMKYVGPVASGMGLQFEEVAAAVGLMGNAGIQGSMAGTALRGAISALVNPTKKTADMMADLGINALDARGKMLPLNEIVRQLEDSGASAAEIMALFGQRAGPAMVALVEQGADALSNLTAELENSGGTAERVAKTQMEGFKGMMLELESAFEGLMIAIADSGFLEWATNVARSFIGFLQRLSETNPELLKLATIVGVVLAALGPMLLVAGTALKTFSGLAGVVRMLTKGYGDLVRLGGKLATEGFPTLSSGAGSLGATLSKLVGGPMGLTIAAVAALAAGFIYLWNTNESFREAVMEIWTMITTALGDMWQSLSETLQVIWGWIVEVGKALFGEFAAFWETWGGTILTLTSSIWHQIKLVIETAANLIKDVVGLVLAVIRGDWEEAWTRIQSIADTIWNAISGTAENLGNALKAIFQGIATFIETIFKGIINFIIRQLNKVIDAANWVIKQLNKISFTLPSWVPGLGGKSFGINISLLSHIPQLAEGGIVMSPTLALIGEAGPEAVMPLSRMDATQGPQVTIQWSSIARPSDAEVRQVAELVDGYLGGRLGVRMV